jgi:hypothetical protein
MALLVALVAASGAQAAQRYAAPEGAGTTCEKAAPCLLKEAINKASANDEVIVTAGSYTATEVIVQNAENLNIHGDPSGPMPTITTALGVAPLVLSGKGAHLAYVDIAASSATPLALQCDSLNATIERVRLRATGQSARGLFERTNCSVRDSTIRAEGENSRALAFFREGGLTTSVLRNLTVLATGTNAVAVRVVSETDGSESHFNLDMKNVIADGPGGDLVALGGSGVSTAKITVTNSNFDAATAGAQGTIDASGNQQAAPLFVDAANGDYREAAGSSTIDAGSTDQIGPLDLAGSARFLGLAPDIGAYEFPSPPPAGGGTGGGGGTAGGGAGGGGPGQLQSLAVAPKSFKAATVGGAVISAKKRSGSGGATVTYVLSAPASVRFTVEHASAGRKAGKKCVKQTKANKGKKKCALLKPLGPSFSATGTAGGNGFKFSGRLGNKALKPGVYDLTASAGAVLKRAPFTILK